MHKSNYRNTFGVGIIEENGKILADERSVYIPPKGKGIIPQEAAEHHKLNSEKILQNALEKANITMDEIDIISYSCGPGLSLPLIITADFAIGLSNKYTKPLIAVNHQLSHVEIGKLMTGAKDPIISYHSGGSSQTIAFSGGKYRVFGECHGMAIGNVLDVIAREMGLPMPGGPEIDKLALKGKYVELPYTIKGMDFSLTGILTAAIKKYKSGTKPEDIAYSLEETCFAMITEATERALAHTDKQEVLLVGGVAASKRLGEMINQMCSDRGAKLYVVPKKYSGDNGIMIAWTGLLAYNSGWKADFKDKIKPNWRIDEVEITWLK